MVMCVWGGHLVRTKAKLKKYLHINKYWGCRREQYPVRPPEHMNVVFLLYPFISLSVSLITTNLHQNKICIRNITKHFQSSRSSSFRTAELEWSWDFEWEAKVFTSTSPVAPTTLPQHKYIRLCPCVRVSCTCLKKEFKLLTWEEERPAQNDEGSIFLLSCCNRGEECSVTVSSDFLSVCF